MDYQMIRKWLRFFEKDGVGPEQAVKLLFVRVFDNFVSFEAPSWPVDRVDDK